MKIAKEQCKSELSATLTCSMPWPVFYHFISTATGTRGSNAIYRAYQICEGEIKSTILTNREFPNFQLRVHSKLQIISHIYVVTYRLRPGPKPEDLLGTDMKIDQAYLIHMPKVIYYQTYNRQVINH